MPDLRQQLVENYEAHPAFHFGTEPFACDATALTRFGAAYEEVRTSGTRPSADALRDAKQVCSEAMTAVFSSFASQAADELEAMFVSELRHECERLLEEEFQTYARRAPAATHAVPADSDTRRLVAERHYFGRLPVAAVEEILALGTADVAAFRENAARGRLAREDLSRSRGAGIPKMVAILNREFRALGVLDAVSDSSGTRMAVSGVAFELSLPQATWWAHSFQGLARAPGTLYAHLDESIGNPKSIVYLTDVDPTTGPTSCYPFVLDRLGLHPLQEIIGRVVNVVGNVDSPLKDHYAKQYHQSMTSEGFRRHFMRLPPELRFNSHFGWDVLPDSALEASLMDAERMMLGERGTFIVFDGARLLHRGGLVTEGERLALQVVFSADTAKRRMIRLVRTALP